MAESNPYTAPAATSDPPAAPAGSETAKSAGRGGLAIAAAKVSFVVFGFGQQLVLPAVLGTAGYGRIALILATVSILNNIVVGASIQGVSRTLSRATKTEAPGAFRRVLEFHTLIAVVLASLFALAAGPVAKALHSDIAPDLRIMALVVLCYGIYAPLVGGLNGTGRFVEQAGLDILYGALRFATTAGGAVVAIYILRADGVRGGVMGFALAALLIVPIAVTRSKTGAAGAIHPTAKEYFAFLAPLSIGLVSLNLLLQTDFELFSHFTAERVASLGEPAERANEIIGVYRAFQLFSFLPYQLLMSITFVLFPLLARAHAAGEAESVKRFTETGMRLALLLVGLFVGIVAALPYPLLRFAFKDQIIAAWGSKAQPNHALGMAAFAMLGVMTAALTSLKKEGVAALLTTAGVALVAILCAVMIPRAELGTPMMVASATATLIALSSVAVLGAVVLRRIAGGILPLMTLVRVALATGAAVLVGSRLPYFGRATAPVEAIVVALVYSVCLIVSAEIGRSDLAVVRSVVARRQAR